MLPWSEAGLASGDSKTGWMAMNGVMKWSSTTSCGSCTSTKLIGARSVVGSCPDEIRRRTVAPNHRPIGGRPAGSRSRKIETTCDIHYRYGARGMHVTFYHLSSINNTANASKANDAPIFVASSATKRKADDIRSGVRLSSCLFTFALEIAPLCCEAKVKTGARRIINPARVPLLA